MRTVTLAALGLAAGIACGGDVDPSSGPLDIPDDPRALTQRYAVASAESGDVWVFDQQQGDMRAHIELGQAPASLRVSNRGRYALLIQHQAGQVRALDGGAYMVPHGDHYHTLERTPRLLEFVYEYPYPTQVVASPPWLTVFFEGSAAESLDAKAVAFDERTFAPQGMPTTYAATAEPHAGGISAALANRIFLTEATGALEVRDLTGASVGELPSCNLPAAVEVVSGVAVFVCDLGLLLVRVENASGALSEQWISYAELSVSGVHVLRKDHRHGRVLAPTPEGLLVLEVEDGDSALFTMDGTVCDAGVEMEEGALIAVLQADGSLHTIAAHSGAPVSHADNVSETMECQDALRPQLALGRRVAVVTSPADHKAVEISLDDPSVSRTFSIPHAPAHAVVLANDPDLY